jgi:hypothetical protein
MEEAEMMTPSDSNNLLFSFPHSEELSAVGFSWPWLRTGPRQAQQRGGRWSSGERAESGVWMERVGAQERAETASHALTTD